MKNSRIYRRLSGLSQGDHDVQALVVLVQQVYDASVAILGTVVLYMRQYTLHNKVHVDNVVDIMDRLLPEPVLDNLRPMELAALILSAALHDIGMAADQGEIEAIKRGQSADFNSYRAGYPKIVRKAAAARDRGEAFTAEELESFLISEYLRKNHGDRCKKYIFNKIRSTLKYGRFQFAARLAEVCVSHTRGADDLDEIPCWEVVRAGGERCNWRFVAVMLRLADILDFDAKRTPHVLFEHLGIRDHVSLKEWGKHLAVNAWDIGPRRITYNAKCADPVIQKTTYDFLDLIDAELALVPRVVARMHHPDNSGLGKGYCLDLPIRVDRDEIGPEEGIDGPIYKFIDIQFTLNRDKLISLVLGVQLYADRSLFLRELLQNAIDACRHRAAIHRAAPALGPFVPSVVVRLDQGPDGASIEVEDNGTGMDEHLMTSFFAQVGKSYYTSDEFLERKARDGLDFEPISQFGVGILSTFMAGDRLRVESLHWSRDAPPLLVEIADEGSLFWCKQGDRSAPGTKVTLRLNRPVRELFPARSDGRPAPGADPDAIGAAVQALAPHVEFPIQVEAEDVALTTTKSWLADQFQPGQEHIRAIDLDLTGGAPAGLNGVARAFLLYDPDANNYVVGLRPTDDQSDDVDEFIAYQHEPGYIRADITTVLRTGRKQFGSSPLVQSFGRWSQRGIAVACDLFPTFPKPGQAHLRFAVPFYLPIQYDLDLSGRFVLPLSADRKHVLLSDEARQTGQLIATEIAKLLFARIGVKTLRLHKELFAKILSGQGADPVVKALEHYLRR
jgi:hypothetical protein